MSTIPDRAAAPTGDPEGGRPEAGEDRFDEQDQLDELDRFDEPEQPAGLSGRTGGIIMAALAGVAWVAALVLMLEKIQVLRDPNYEPSCSINPVLSCGSIMNSAQAEAFGLPNPLIGIAGFAAVIALGVVLAAGVALPRWIWWGLQAGVTFGLGFICWLAFQSLYRIGALCPYCMVVWAMMIPLFWFVTSDNLVKGRIPVGAGVRRVIGAVGALPIVLGYVVIGLLILVRFWDFWIS
ncbi:vitamin K epoxide reductase family protein [Enemella evansiae]|uniref:vitamin K epoxide reductase family protein n=1 Tax=Enemella evansiae TaxID=2016499 RepID=UPI001E362858|nr:vitamin K epoxide reductase family protein [Enemella evansiae]